MITNEKIINAVTKYFDKRSNGGRTVMVDITDDGYGWVTVLFDHEKENGHVYLKIKDELLEKGFRLINVNDDTNQDSLQALIGFPTTKVLEMITEDLN